MIVLLLDLALVFAWTSAAMQSAFRPDRFYMHFFVHGEGPLPLRTTLLALLGTATVLMLLSAVNWIHETWRYGWEAYRPWRITAGLWSVVGLAVAAHLTFEVWRIPQPEALAARAATQAIQGDGFVMRVALLYNSDEAEEACRRLLSHDDPSVRFEAAVYLYLYAQQGPTERAALANNAAWLRRCIFAGAGMSAVNIEALRRFHRAFYRLGWEELLHKMPRDFSEEDPFWEEWNRFERTHLAH